MRNPLARSLLVIAMVLFATISSRAQVPLDCIGVQRRATEIRVGSLPSVEQGRYAPVLNEIRALHDNAASEARRADVAWDELRTRLRAANRGLSDAAANAQLLSLIRQSALHDGRYADVLRAIYKAHITEGQVIDRTRTIHTPDDARQVDQLVQRFTSRHANIRGAARLAQESQSFRHLASILEANRTAMASSEAIPAPALTKPGFDTAPEELRIAAAVQGASNLLGKVDTAGQVSNLIRSHLESRLGDRDQRAGMMRDAQSRTAREAASQIARAQNWGLQRGYVVRELSKVESDIERLPPPTSRPAQEGFIGRVAEKVEKKVEQLRKTVVVLE
jgi:hypothetical protein